MTSRLEVELHGEPIGELVEEGAHAAFRFFPSYWTNPSRAVLGQWFEDGRPDEVYRGPGSLPAFFANLEPEGPLARWLARKNRIGTGPLDLLGVAGDDLPGAIRLRSADPIGRSPRSVVYLPPRAAPAFSLAGVQLKLPMSLDRDDRLTLPMDDHLSEWFLKVPTSGRHRGVAQNEAATMNWARCAGFQAAECVVRDDPPRVEGIEEVGEPCLLVRRYDRTADGPVHQEDLAQAQWLDPEQKYPVERRALVFDSASELRRRGLTSVQGLARYASRLLGPDGLEEFVRRFLFVVASGNGDAHVKNWSLWYPGRRLAAWSPLYDQVSTVAWADETLACPLYGTPNFAAIARPGVVRMAVEAGCTAVQAEEIVAETLTRCRNGWEQATAEVPYPADHHARLLHHWTAVPLLRAFGPLPRG